MPSGRLPNERWHCVAANHGQGFLAEESLARDGWSVLHPLYLSRRPGRDARILPLFPGYLFIAFDRQHQDWPRICRARGVHHLLGSPGRPQPVPAGYIEDLQARMSPRRIVDDPLMRAPVVPRRGQRLALTEGAFAGWTGVCQMSAADRVHLLLSLFGGRQVSVAVPLAAVVSA